MEYMALVPLILRARATWAGEESADGCRGGAYGGAFFTRNAPLYEFAPRP